MSKNFDRHMMHLVFLVSHTKQARYNVGKKNIHASNPPPDGYLLILGIGTRDHHSSTDKFLFFASSHLKFKR